MAWAKKKPMSWEWFQDDCVPTAVAATCALIAESRRVIKFIVGPIEGRVIIVSCKGTPKKKDADE